LDRLEARREWLVVPLKEVLDDVVTAVITVAADLDVTAFSVPPFPNYDTYRDEANLKWWLQDSLDEESWSGLATGWVTPGHAPKGTTPMAGDVSRPHSMARITQPLGRATRLLLHVSATHAQYTRNNEDHGDRYFVNSEPVTSVGLAAARIEVRLGLRVLAGGQV
jgi:hypothetical protein